MYCLEDYLSSIRSCSDPLSAVLLSWFQTEAVFTGSGRSTSRTDSLHVHVFRGSVGLTALSAVAVSRTPALMGLMRAAPGWYATDHTFIHGPS